MTTAALRRDDSFEGPAWLRGPQEGWLAVIAFTVMIGAVALSIDAAHWAGFVPEGPSETGFLLPVMLLAALWGFVSAKLGWPALAADAVGAAVGAGVLLLAVAGIVAPGAPPGTALTALSDSVYRFYHDLVIEGVRSSETSVFLLVLGAAMWTVAQLAAVNLFARHRGLAVVAMTGVAIFVQLSVAAQDEYGYLVVFAVAALVLLMRLNLLDQRVGWMRRGIGDQGAVTTLYTRSGATFIALTLIGALALTATASSAPLAGVLNQPAVRDQLVNLGEQLNTLVGGVVGNARGPNGLFATSSTITGLWESSSTVVFTATTDTGQGYYWRGATYDTFDGTTWKQVDRTNAGDVAAGAPVLAASADGATSLVARATVKTTIHDVNLGSSTLVAPEDVVSVDQPTTVYTAGPGGGFDSAELTNALGAGDSYTATSLVVPQGDEKGAPTESQLAAAGTDYPATVAPYLQYKGAVGDETIAVARSVASGLPASQQDAFHIAKAIQAFFLDPANGFRYQTDVRGECPSGDIVDCFLVESHRVGYCEYFASSMVMMLRTLGIPARYVKGYLPGEQLADGSFQVEASAAHAWAQVYFPGYGWIRFDPTPGAQRDLGQAATVFVRGSPVAGTPSPSIGPVQSGADETDPLRRTLPPLTPGSVSSGGPGVGLLAVLVIGLLALLLAFGVWRSRRSGALSRGEPDAVYRGLVGFATRLGYGQLPTQTAYEYAGALGELVPAARDELQLVARAKVEVTYGRRTMAGDRLVALHAAYRRLRVRLLRLVFRRQRGFRPRRAGPRSGSPR
ncbi:MAG TPA: transglutaminaseTgpA domain-containing protein [Candidatus Sulfotelmatobacter sp.]|nr:transglutaminaseTgpA domain-containing protein [Candidatus Sulfotelmatobacter sp.]